jgi:hypothetical protein
LPLPSPESTHVREILADLGIIQKDAFAEKPYYDERFILHAPEERLLFNGHWQDGFIPTEGVPQWERMSTSASSTKCTPAPAARCGWAPRVCVPDRAVVGRPAVAGAGRHHAQAVDGAERLQVADAALVSQLLLPRRLRHALRPGIGMGRAALLLQPLGAANAGNGAWRGRAACSRWWPAWSARRRSSAWRARWCR